MVSYKPHKLVAQAVYIDHWKLKGDGIDLIINLKQQKNK